MVKLFRPGGDRIEMVRLFRSGGDRIGMVKLFRLNGEIIGEGNTILEICEKHWANLKIANLGEAYLRRAFLIGADLEGANLKGADLKGADLMGARLEGSNLGEADLKMANLEGTCLDPNVIMPTTDLSAFKIDVVTGELIGYRTKHQPYMYGPVYKIGQEYIAPWFSVSVGTVCHPGLYLCPLSDGIKDVIEVRALIQDTIKCGSKYRTKKFRVVG